MMTKTNAASDYYKAPKYPSALNQRVTGGYGGGQCGTVTYAVADRFLVRWDNGTSNWQARWILTAI